MSQPKEIVPQPPTDFRDFSSGGPNVIEGGKIDPRKPYEKWPRKVKQFNGSVPVGVNQNPLIKFKTTEPCDIRDAKGRACGENLIAERVVNFHFVKAKLGSNPVQDPKAYTKEGGGGQLEYDFSDFRYYMYCPIHGPIPSGPARWDSDGKALD